VALANKENNEAAQLPASPHEKHDPRAPRPAAPQPGRDGSEGQSPAGPKTRRWSGSRRAELPLAAGIPAGTSSLPFYFILFEQNLHVWGFLSFFFFF